eukprot:GHVQ01033234.1.p1 GENE.GHVQ01033234.1~~GHVQ01033234.1.p1  ORF type:complete len:2115 (+),score=409.74 GHVQ01033234.1:373-6717(+)
MTHPHHINASLPHLTSSCAPPALLPSSHPRQKHNSHPPLPPSPHSPYPAHPPKPPPPLSNPLTPQRTTLTTLPSSPPLPTTPCSPNPSHRSLANAPGTRLAALRGRTKTASLGTTATTAPHSRQEYVNCARLQRSAHTLCQSVGVGVEGGGGMEVSSGTVHTVCAVFDSVGEEGGEVNGVPSKQSKFGRSLEVMPDGAASSSLSSSCSSSLSSSSSSACVSQRATDWQRSKTCNVSTRCVLVPSSTSSTSVYYPPHYRYNFFNNNCVGKTRSYTPPTCSSSAQYVQPATTSTCESSSSSSTVCAGITASAIADAVSLSKTQPSYECESRNAIVDGICSARTCAESMIFTSVADRVRYYDTIIKLRREEAAAAVEGAVPCPTGEWKVPGETQDREMNICMSHGQHDGPMVDCLAQGVIEPVQLLAGHIWLAAAPPPDGHSKAQIGEIIQPSNTQCNEPSVGDDKTQDKTYSIGDSNADATCAAVTACVSNTACVDIKPCYPKTINGAASSDVDLSTGQPICDNRDSLADSFQPETVSLLSTSLVMSSVEPSQASELSVSLHQSVESSPHSPVGSVPVVGLDCCVETGSSVVQEGSDSTLMTDRQAEEFCQKLWSERVVTVDMSRHRKEEEKHSRGGPMDKTTENGEINDTVDNVKENMYKRTDGTCLLRLFLCLDSEMLYHIHNLPTSYDFWTSLQHWSCASGLPNFVTSSHTKDTSTTGCDTALHGQSVSASILQPSSGFGLCLKLPQPSSSSSSTVASNLYSSKVFSSTRQILKTIPWDITELHVTHVSADTSLDAVVEKCAHDKGDETDSQMECMELYRQIVRALDKCAVVSLDTTSCSLVQHMMSIDRSPGVRAAVEEEACTSMCEDCQDKGSVGNASFRNSCQRCYRSMRHPSVTNLRKLCLNLGEVDQRTDPLTIRQDATESIINRQLPVLSLFSLPLHPSEVSSSSPVLSPSCPNLSLYRVVESSYRPVLPLLSHLHFSSSSSFHLAILLDALRLPPSLTVTPCQHSYIPAAVCSPTDPDAVLPFGLTNSTAASFGAQQLSLQQHRGSARPCVVESPSSSLSSVCEGVQTPVSELSTCATLLTHNSYTAADKKESLTDEEETSPGGGLGDIECGRVTHVSNSLCHLSITCPQHNVLSTDISTDISPVACSPSKVGTDCVLLPSLETLQISVCSPCLPLILATRLQHLHLSACSSVGSCGVHSDASSFTSRSSMLCGKNHVSADRLYLLLHSCSRTLLSLRVDDVSPPISTTVHKEGSSCYLPWISRDDTTYQVSSITQQDKEAKSRAVQKSSPCTDGYNSNSSCQSTDSSIHSCGSDNSTSTVASSFVFSLLCLPNLHTYRGTKSVLYYLPTLFCPSLMHLHLKDTYTDTQHTQTTTDRFLVPLHNLLSHIPDTDNHQVAASPNKKTVHFLQPISASSLIGLFLMRHRHSITTLSFDYIPSTFSDLFRMLSSYDISPTVLNDMVEINSNILSSPTHINSQQLCQKQMVNPSSKSIVSLRDGSRRTLANTLARLFYSCLVHNTPSSSICLQSQQDSTNISEPQNTNPTTTTSVNQIVMVSLTELRVLNSTPMSPTTSTTTSTFLSCQQSSLVSPMTSAFSVSIPSELLCPSLVTVYINGVCSIDDILALTTSHQPAAGSLSLHKPLVPQEEGCPTKTRVCNTDATSGTIKASDDRCLRCCSTIEHVAVHTLLLDPGTPTATVGRVPFKYSNGETSTRPNCGTRKPEPVVISDESSTQMCKLRRGKSVILPPVASTSEHPSPQPKKTAPSENTTVPASPASHFLSCVLQSRGQRYAAVASVFLQSLSLLPDLSSFHMTSCSGGLGSIARLCLRDKGLVRVDDTTRECLDKKLPSEHQTPSAADSSKCVTDQGKHRPLSLSSYIGCSLCLSSCCHTPLDGNNADGLLESSASTPTCATESESAVSGNDRLSPSPWMSYRRSASTSSSPSPALFSIPIVYGKTHRPPIHDGSFTHILPHFHQPSGDTQSSDNPVLLPQQERTSSLTPLHSDCSPEYPHTSSHPPPRLRRSARSSVCLPSAESLLALPRSVGEGTQLATTTHSSGITARTSAASVAVGAEIVTSGSGPTPQRVFQRPPLPSGGVTSLKASRRD